MSETGTLRVKSGLAEMLKGGVIMDVTDADQARIAEDAGACAVMALERVPADIRAQGGVARMSEPDEDPRDPGGGDDPGDGEGADRPLRRGAGAGGARGRLHRRVRGADARRRGNHIDKWPFKVPFVCGATNLGEALRRIAEGAAMIRTKGEAGTGNVVEAVRHMRSIRARSGGLPRWARTSSAPRPRTCGAVRPGPLSRETGSLPVVTFTPAASPRRRTRR